MIPATLNPIEAVRSGWRQTREHFAYLCSLLLLLALAVLAPVPVRIALLRSCHPHFAVVVMLSAIALQTVVLLGVLRSVIRLQDNGDRTLVDIVECADLVVYGLVALVLVLVVSALTVLPVAALAMALSLLALLHESFVAPAALACALLLAAVVTVTLRYAFVPFLLADRHSGPVAALRNSARLTRGNRGRLFVLFLILAALNAAGMAVAGLGVLASLPLSACSLGYAYRRLAPPLGSGDTAQPGGDV